MANCVVNPRVDCPVRKNTLFLEHQPKCVSIRLKTHSLQHRVRTNSGRFRPGMLQPGS